MIEEGSYRRGKNNNATEQRTSARETEGKSEMHTHIYIDIDIQGEREDLSEILSS